MFRASAPGKLVLLGEYSVLEGAPALAMAVDRRAVAELAPASSPQVSSVCAPDIWPDTECFTLGADGAPVWHNQNLRLADAMSLVSCVMRAFSVPHQTISASFDLKLFSAPFFSHSHRDGMRIKLGLGSSAAVTAAMASVLAARAGRLDMLKNRQDWLSNLLSVHRNFQHGRGSGIDIAAAVYGGVICYELRSSPYVRKFGWPSELFQLWVWSGQSASTSDFLAQLYTWKKERPAECSRHMSRLAKIAESGSQALIDGDADVLYWCIEEAALALQAFGDASKIPIFSPHHLKISALVKGAGGVYKPCGAGGGDLGLAVTQDATIAGRVRAALQLAGYAVLDLDMDRVGLTLEQVPEGV